MGQHYIGPFVGGGFPWNNTKEGPCASELLLIEFSPNLIGIAVPLYLAAASNLF